MTPTTRTLNRVRHRITQARKATEAAKTALFNGDIDTAIRRRNLASRLAGTAKRLLRAEAAKALEWVEEQQFNG
jgi:hypothetical protein